MFTVTTFDYLNHDPNPDARRPGAQEGPPLMNSLVTFDLDSTLADTRHRHGLINPDGVSTDWRAYSMACMNDEPIWPVVTWARAMRDAGHALWIVSGRDADALLLTKGWLANIAGLEVDGLILNSNREPHDHMEYKVKAIRQATAMARAEHLFHVDDWPPVATACAAAGIKCVTVTPPRIIDGFMSSDHLTFV